jgi:hypothetical protein
VWIFKLIVDPISFGIEQKMMRGIRDRAKRSAIE